MIYKLNKDPYAWPIKQKWRFVNPERYVTIIAKVEKLVKAGLIQEAYYLDWLENIL